MIEFTRPLDVNYDNSFYLVPGGDYKIFIHWGIFTSDTDDKKSRVKGMQTRLTSGGPFAPAVDNGQKWVLEKPPGWDELMLSLANYTPAASFASKMAGSSILACAMLIFSFY